MKKAIIMGATSGMGLGVAEQLLDKGWTIGVAGRRKEALETIKKKAPERVYTKVIDVTDADASALLLELVADMGGVDMYFHSSGYGKYNPDVEMDIERQTVLTNGLGFTQMVDTMFNYFKEQKRKGSIAVISSVAGTKGLGAAPSYSATKRFQWTYIEALAQNARMHGLDIRFMDIRPGFVATDFIKGSNFPMQMSADYVVKKIMKALSSQNRVTIIDWRYSIVCFFWRHLPQCVWERLPIK